VDSELRSLFQRLAFDGHCGGSRFAAFLSPGGEKILAHYAAIWGFVASVLLAGFVFGMPWHMVAGAVSAGVVFGIIRIAWTLLAAVFVYELTVESGHFEIIAGIDWRHHARPPFAGFANRLRLRRDSRRGRRRRRAGSNRRRHEGWLGISTVRRGRTVSDRQHVAGGIRRRWAIRFARW
jgi:hypothetical protein